MKAKLSICVGLLGYYSIRIARYFHIIFFVYHDVFGHQAWNPEFFARLHYLKTGRWPKLVGIQRSGFVPNFALYKHHQRCRVTILKKDHLFSRIFRAASRHQTSRTVVPGLSGLGSIAIARATMNELHGTDQVENAPTAFPLDVEEAKKASEILELFSLVKNSYFCFQDREIAYKYAISGKTAHQYGTTSFEAGLDMLRNTSLQTFYAGAELLNEKGIRAVRMGAHVARRAECPSIVDYAWAREDIKDDYSDLALIANCKFFAGPNSGIWLFARSMKRPICLVNVFPWPWINVPLASNSVVLPKRLWLKPEKRFLDIHEMVAMEGNFYWKRLYSTEFFENLNIEVIENNEDEIASALFEINSRLDGTWEGRDYPISSYFSNDNVGVHSESWLAGSFIESR